MLEKYYPAILGDNSSPFSNFTQDDRDTYTRLKFRAINKRNTSQHNEEAKGYIAQGVNAQPAP